MENLSSEAIVSFNDEDSPTGEKISQVQGLLSFIERQLPGLLVQGVEASVMAPGGHWRNGRLQLTLSFEEKDAVRVGGEE
ncbi:MAG: hypothetical protein F6J92_21595 [Symploca sp. SIO1A3]|nr:hypothetical protein [Symploca sp. SIO1A3]